jgi:hypothetical protein
MLPSSSLTVPDVQLLSRFRFMASLAKVYDGRSGLPAEDAALECSEPAPKERSPATPPRQPLLPELRVQGPGEQHRIGDHEGDFHREFGRPRRIVHRQIDVSGPGICGGDLSEARLRELLDRPVLQVVNIRSLPVPIRQMGRMWSTLRCSSARPSWVRWALSTGGPDCGMWKVIAAATGSGLEGGLCELKRSEQAPRYRPDGQCTIHAAH